MCKNFVNSSSKRMLSFLDGQLTSVNTILFQAMVLCLNEQDTYISVISQPQTNPLRIGVSWPHLYHFYVQQVHTSDVNTSSNLTISLRSHARSRIIANDGQTFTTAMSTNKNIPRLRTPQKHKSSQQYTQAISNPQAREFSYTCYEYTKQYDM